MNVLNLNSCGNLKHGTKYIKDMKTEVGGVTKTMWQNPTTEVNGNGIASINSGLEGIVPSALFKGKTSKFNQLVQNGNFVDTSHWFANFGTLSANNNKGIITATDTAWSVAIRQVISCVQNHKYYVGYYLKPIVSGITRCYWNTDFISDGMPTTANVRTKFDFFLPQTPPQRLLCIFI